MFGVRKHTSTGRRKTRDELLQSYYSQWRVLCECGHSLIINPHDKKKICTHCGHWVYSDKKEEFKEKLDNARKNI